MNILTLIQEMFDVVMCWVMWEHFRSGSSFVLQENLHGFLTRIGVEIGDYNNGFILST